MPCDCLFIVDAHRAFFIYYGRMMVGSILKLLISSAGVAIVGPISYVMGLNDYRLPIFSLESFTGIKRKTYRVLAIDPHPDDETMISGGTFSWMAHRVDVELRHICFTKGEKGNELISPHADILASIREGEYRSAVNELGINNYQILNFPDGGLMQTKEKVKVKLKEEIASFKPDIILTYEQGGLYGHPDHIALTEVAQQLVKEFFPEVKILYKTLPGKMIEDVKTSVQMALEKGITHNLPKYRFPLGKAVWPKYRAARKHKSQNLGHGKPLLLVMLVLSSEYFTD